MVRSFKITDVKPLEAVWPINIDLSPYLNGAEIITSTFHAKDFDNGEDATSVVIDSLSFHSNTAVVPILKGGEDGSNYIAEVIFTTDHGTTDVVTVLWSVQNIYTDNVSV